MESFSVEGNLWMLSNPLSCSRQVQLDQVVQSIAQLSFECPLRGGDATTSLSNLFQRLTTLMVKILFLYLIGISHIAVLCWFVCCFMLSLCTFERDLVLNPPIR